VQIGKIHKIAHWKEIIKTCILFIVNASSFLEKEDIMQEQITKKVYDVADIQQLLGLGRSKAYDFLEEVYRNKRPFIVLKIGKLYKVPKESFDSWINGENSIPIS
jgi:hypothetical protein